MSQTLRELFLAHGAALEMVTHQRPISSQEVLLVEGSAVDIFLYQWEGKSRAGRRHFLNPAGPETAVIVGLETPEGFGLMLASLGTAEVLVLPQPALPELTSKHADVWQGPLQDWLLRLTRAAIDEPLPILARSVAPGHQETSRGPGRYYPRQPVLVQVHSGSVRLAEKELASFTTDLLLPLLPTTWLTVEKDTHFEVIDFAQGLARSDAWPSLARYGQSLMNLLVADQERQAQIDRERIDRRAVVDADTRRRAWKQMARVLTRERLEAIHQPTAVEPLLLCCQRLSKNLGVPIVAPVRASANAPLDDIARASNLRVRTVKLDSGWWKMDGGPLLGWLKQDDRPVALTVPRAGVYLMEDPSDASAVRVDEKVAERLKPYAATFYRRLPDRSIGLKELFSLALISSKRDLVSLMVLGAGIGLLALATPVATKLLFDEILPLGDISYLHQLMWGLLLVCLCNVGFMVTYSVALTRFGGRFGSNLATPMFDRLLTLPMSFFRQYAIGDLAQRALGITRIRDLVTGGTMTKVISSIFALSSFALLLVYDLKLAFLAGLLLALNLAFSTRAGLTQLRLRRQAADLSGQVNGILYQILGGLPKLRVAGAESRFFAYWSARFARQMDFEYRAGNLGVAVSVFNTAFPVVSSLLLFGYVGLAHDQIATGTLLGFMAAYGQCTAAIAALSDSASEISAALPQLERTAPILAAVPEKDELKIDPGELSGAIELSNVCFRYNADQAKILSRVSIKVEPREFVALVGGTGAGKSTVLNLLLGFDRPESGSVFYDKKDLSMLDVQGVRQQIGVVLQNGRIVKDTVYSNIASGRPISVEQTWEALTMVNLEADVQAMPLGLDTVISPETFSGGQAQRLLIARAIVSRPRIIFFDEATSALDNQTQAVVSRSLEHLNAARVVIAHRLSTIRAADRIYVMSEGQVVQVGNFDELSAVPGLFAELMARQQDSR